MQARALYITEDITFVSEQPRAGRHLGITAVETPPTGDDLAVLLERLAAVATRDEASEMSVYLDPGMARQLGFPADLPTKDKCVKHPTMLTARGHGWKVERVRRWMTFERAETPTIHIGLAQWMKQSENPLWDNEPGAAAYLLRRFHDITGHAYHAKPMVIASQMIKTLYADSKTVIVWHPEYPDTAREIFRTLTRTVYDFTNRGMVDQLTSGYVHTYDTNRAYLAGAGAAELARTPLVHTGLVHGFRPRVAGLWRVVVPHWNDLLLPHPMGTNRHVGDDLWVSTPTLELVAQLADKGLIEMPRILDSWTAPARRHTDPKSGKSRLIPHTTRVLREWAERIDTCVQRAANEETEPIEREKLLEALKGLYRESVNGFWKTSGSQIFREDWYHGTDAVVGANLFRKLHQTKEAGGPTPLVVSDTDAIHFASEKADPKEDQLARFRIGERLGQYDVTTLTADEWHTEFLQSAK